MNGATSSVFPKALSKSERDAASAAQMTVAPLTADIFNAACKGQERLVNSWLRDGGSINARDPQFQATLLMGAALGGHEDLVHALLKQGANIDLQNALGGTALMNAASEGHLKIIERLLKEGADAKLCHHRGQRALEFAQAKHPVVAEVLREHMGELAAVAAPRVEESPLDADVAASPPVEASGGATSVAAAPFASSTLPEGTRVRIVALLSRQDLNGAMGTISSFNSERGRYNVDVKGETIALQPENCKALQDPKHSPPVDLA